jgi:hypothetical protein
VTTGATSTEIDTDTDYQTTNDKGSIGQRNSKWDIGAPMAPIINAALHDQSVAKGGIKPDTMPVIPAIRPLNIISKIAAIPINTPPKSDAQGVNSVTVSIISLRYLQAIIVIILSNQSF